jgi:hypothetical protein
MWETAEKLWTSCGTLASENSFLWSENLPILIRVLYRPWTKHEKATACVQVIGDSLSEENAAASDVALADTTLSVLESADRNWGDRHRKAVVTAFAPAKRLASCYHNACIEDVNKKSFHRILQSTDLKNYDHHRAEIPYIFQKIIWNRFLLFVFE